jgi:2-polyprenyl-3-methyl-5-hydroxy-6-metoxy-1,4-benzoquinol methylase
MPNQGASKAMLSATEIWRDILTDGRNMPPTEAVIFQLADYSARSVDEVKEIVRDTNEISKQKWSEADRSTPDGLRAFYSSVTNWVFGNISYHARQAEGRDGPYPALPVQVADALKNLKPGHHLDFGSGVGTASLLFHKFGWQITLADVSTPLLDFARWRLSRSSVPAEFIDLNKNTLEERRYELITAFNTMAHVPNVRQTISEIRTALKPDGLLVFDIDARKPAPRNEWFLYEHPYQVLRGIRALGFTRMPPIGAMQVYRRAELGHFGALRVAIADFLRFNAFTSTLGSATRSARSRLKRLLSGGPTAHDSAGPGEKPLRCVARADADGSGRVAQLDDVPALISNFDCEGAIDASNPEGRVTGGASQTRI